MSRDSDDSVDALLRAVADSPAISTTSVVGERFGLIRRLGEDDRERRDERRPLGVVVAVALEVVRVDEQLIGAQERAEFGEEGWRHPLIMQAVSGTVAQAGTA